MKSGKEEREIQLNPPVSSRGLIIKTHPQYSKNTRKPMGETSRSPPTLMCRSNFIEGIKIPDNIFIVTIMRIFTDFKERIAQVVSKAHESIKVKNITTMRNEEHDG